MNDIKVLVVEDEALIAANLKMQLKMFNFDVLPPVAKAEKAVAVSTSERPDVILMDIRLSSKMNGIEAAREIMRTYNPIIIFTTGYDDDTFNYQINSLKASIFYKPIDIRKIIETIRTRLSENC